MLENQNSGIFKFCSDSQLKQQEENVVFPFRPHRLRPSRLRNGVEDEIRLS